MPRVTVNASIQIGLVVVSSTTPITTPKASPGQLGRPLPIVGRRCSR